MVETAFDVKTIDHLSDDQLEDYVMNRLALAQLMHLATCTTCRDRLMQVWGYVSAMKSQRPG